MRKILSLFAAVLFAGSMMATDLLNIDFTQGQGQWTINNVNIDTLEYVWKQDATYGMKASAYVGGNHATEAWLISPAIDMSAVEAATLAFSHARKYGSLDQLSVKASADGANWTDLQVSAWPDGSSWSFVDATADMTAFAGNAAVQVAFVYTSSTSAGATWEIKTVAIAEGDAPVVEEADVTFLPADFADQGVSGTGGDVTATKNGVTVSSNKGFGHSAALRVYKNGSFSVVSTDQQIGKIVFTFGSYQGTPKDGGLASEIVVNAMEYSVEALSAAAYMEKIEIYFGEAEPVVVTIDTVTVAKAIEIGMALADNAKTEKDYVVAGYVVQAYAPNEGFTDQTWFMADEKGAYGEFEAYRCTPDYLVENDQFVYVKGKIQKYVKDEKVQIEIGNGTATHGEAPEGIENITLTEDAQKVVVDGVIYIVRDGKMFNLQGAQVR